MKKLLVILVWLPTTLFTIFLCLFYLHFAYPKDINLNSRLEVQAQRLIHEDPEQLALNPIKGEVLGSSNTTANTQDARPALIYRFLNKYKSPLIPYSQYLVDIADKYGLDYALIPAMAMQESNVCLKIPEASHNCWGYGIYGSKITKFDSFEKAIDRVAQTLKDKYLEESLTNPDLIMSKWTPSSNGSWAYGVNYYMQVIKQAK